MSPNICQRGSKFKIKCIYIGIPTYHHGNIFKYGT